MKENTKSNSLPNFEKNSLKSKKLLFSLLFLLMLCGLVYFRSISDVIFAVLAGLTVFTYLYSQRKVDLAKISGLSVGPVSVTMKDLDPDQKVQDLIKSDTQEKKE